MEFSNERRITRFQDGIKAFHMAIKEINLDQGKNEKQYFFSLQEYSQKRKKTEETP